MKSKTKNDGSWKTPLNVDITRHWISRSKFFIIFAAFDGGNETNKN